MDVTYFTGYDNGCDYSGGHGSPGNSMNDSNYSNAFVKEELISPSTLSPALHYSYDSMVSPSMSSLSRFSVGPHQAEPQPCTATARTTPHSNNLHPRRSQAMSRGPSQISNHSSASSSHHRSYQPCTPQNSHYNDFTMNRVPMLRSASDTPAFQGQSVNCPQSGSLPSNSSRRFLALPLVKTSPTDVSANSRYSPPIANVDNAITNWDWSSLAGLTTFGESFGGFAQTATA